MPDARLLEVEAIETGYGRSQVLFGLSLAIAPGEMVTLMGRNGMGKTTTVRSIMGLTPASAGSIRFAGEEIRASPSYRICPARHRPGAGGAAGVPQPDRAREPGRHRRQPRARSPIPGRSTRFARCSRGWRSGSTAWAACSPAASSRCWRSAAR